MMSTFRLEHKICTHSYCYPIPTNVFSIHTYCLWAKVYFGLEKINDFVLRSSSCSTSCLIVPTEETIILCMSNFTKICSISANSRRSKQIFFQFFEIENSHFGNFHVFPQSTTKFIFYFACKLNFSSHKTHMRKIIA